MCNFSKDFNEFCIKLLWSIIMVDHYTDYEPAVLQELPVMLLHLYNSTKYRSKYVRSYGGPKVS